MRFPRNVDRLSTSRSAWWAFPSLKALEKKIFISRQHLKQSLFSKKQSLTVYVNYLQMTKKESMTNYYLHIYSEVSLLTKKTYTIAIWSLENK